MIKAGVFFLGENLIKVYWSVFILAWLEGCVCDLRIETAEEILIRILIVGRSEDLRYAEWVYLVLNPLRFKQETHIYRIIILFFEIIIKIIFVLECLKAQLRILEALAVDIAI